MWMSSLSPDEIEELLNNKIKFDDIINESSLIFKKTTNNKMRNSQIYFFKYYLSSVLSKVDKASMLTFIEFRSPFLFK